MQKTIRIQVPQSLHQVPIISTLITEYKLTVNIRGAILDQKAIGGGWFDLLLDGEDLNLEQSVLYLKDIGVEIWNEH
ncbi:MAG: NIL domain-containing protein [Cyanobacteria bacterium]|nr:NIL domain-containing protein [Cyanobacteriota bacterium]